jgi:hypothetical protein
VPDPIRLAEEGLGSDTQPPSGSDGQGNSSEALDSSPVDSSPDSRTAGSGQVDATSTTSPPKFQTDYEEAAYVSLTLNESTHAHMIPESLRTPKSELQSLM